MEATIQHINIYDDGLINNNYEMFNFKDIVININNKMRIGYTLMLPINKIYDIFMDVYNINIFESNKYLIDDDNYESWNDKSSQPIFQRFP